MLVDLVSTTTLDGLRLHGALAASPADFAAPLVGAWICLHGTGSNFYSATLLDYLTLRLLNTGGAVLRANTRGHDLISTGATNQGRRLQGAAFERVDESPNDIAAWFDFLAARGYSRIGLLGHSLGAVKAIYSQAQASAKPVAAVVAVSPPRLSHSHFLRSAKGAEFAETFAAASEHVAAGRPDTLMEVGFPLSYIVTAAGYLDRYGPEERYNILQDVSGVGCPLLVTYGSRELQSSGAFDGMPEALELLRTPRNQLQVAVIAGADHVYTACQDALAARIESWLRRVAGASSPA